MPWTRNACRSKVGWSGGDRMMIRWEPYGALIYWCGSSSSLLLLSSLFIYLFIHLFIYLFIYLFICLFVCLSICLFIYSFIHLFIYLIIYLSCTLRKVILLKLLIPLVFWYKKTRLYFSESNYHWYMYVVMLSNTAP
jgi:hypothetical protein